MAGGYRSVAGALAIGAAALRLRNAAARADHPAYEPWPQRLRALLRSLQHFEFDGRLARQQRQ